MVAIHHNESRPSKRVRPWLAAICLAALVGSIALLWIGRDQFAVVLAAAVAGGLIAWTAPRLGGLGAASREEPQRQRAIGSANDAFASGSDLPRLILDEIPGLVSTLLPDGRIEFVNRKTLEFFGRSLSEIRACSNLVHPDDRDRLIGCWQDAVATGRPLDIEIRARRADGAYRWMYSRLHPLRDTHGHVVRWCNLLTDIDARKSAEEALKASEQNLRSSLDHIPGLVHSMTPAGDIEHVNQPILDFFGVPLEDIKDWRQLTHPDDVERVGTLLERSLRTGTPYEYESRGRRADGVYRWFHARGMPLRDEEGRIVRWYGVLTDIDDRRRAEDALRASEQHLRLMVDSIPCMICTNTATGDVDYVNKPLLDYTGEPLDALRNWPAVVHAEDLPTVAERWQHSIATGAPFNVEVRVRRADGVYRWFQCQGLPLRGEDGRILRWYNVLSDMDDRKSAEEQLRAREKELALIIETLPAHIWCASPDGQLIYVNSRVIEYTGATFEELAGDSFNHIHPDDRHVVVEAWKRATRTETPYELQYRKRRADGSFHWVQSIGRLGRDEHGRPARWYGLFIDVDERVNVEEALRDTRAQLARATEIATVGELSAAVAHEINQPLASVMANAHACHRWLTADPPNLARALPSLERIIRDGKSAADVIDRIRALYRRAAPSKAPLSVNDVIEEICRLIDTEARRRSIVLRTELEPNPSPTRADRVQIQQVLSNLTRNAMEAMEAVTDRPRELCIVSRERDDDIVVEVRDSGVGLEDFANAFEPFFTTKPSGMGMGLAICRSIIEAHGGRLWATRAAPHGSIFRFSLPTTAVRDDAIGRITASR